MRAKDFIVEAFDVGFITNYIKKHHDENLHPDFLENLNSFTSFELKNVGTLVTTYVFAKPINSLEDWISSNAIEYLEFSKVLV